jgi:hypothetical protein
VAIPPAHSYPVSLALPELIWSHQHDETGSQFPVFLVHIRQLLECKRSVDPSQAELVSGDGVKFDPKDVLGRS